VPSAIFDPVSSPAAKVRIRKRYTAEVNDWYGDTPGVQASSGGQEIEAALFDFVIPPISESG
jgi:hypothetical protein